MGHALLVQTLKMTAVMRQQWSTKGVTTRENSGIGSGSRPVFLHSKHIMTQQPQFLDDPIVKVLVGVEILPASLHGPLVSLFVFPNCVVNFLAVVGGVLPSCRQVSGGQRGVSA